MVSIESLSALSQYYYGDGARLKQTELSDLRGLADAYAVANASSLLDCASVGFAFDAIFAEKPIDLRRITLAMRDAWDQATPNQPPESSDGQSPVFVAQSTSNWKRRLFDAEVAKRLNRGLWVGNLCLEKGQRALLSPSEGGFSATFQITDEAGPAANAYQTRAIKQIQRFRDALERSAEDPLLVFEQTNTKLALSPRVTSGNGIVALAMTSQSNTERDENGAWHSRGVDSNVFASLAIRSAGKVLSGSSDSRDCHAAQETVLIATPKFFAAFSPVFSQDGERLPATQPPSPEFLPPPVNLEHLRNSSSRLIELVRSLEALYASQKCAPKPKPRCYINDYDELLLLVDSVTRLVIQQGDMPLDRWILSMVTRDATTMPETVLRHYLEDLLAIKANHLVDQAFCGAGFLSRWENAMTGGRTHLAERLDDAIEICELCQKRYTNTLTNADIKRVQLLQAIGSEIDYRAPTRSGIQDYKVCG